MIVRPPVRAAAAAAALLATVLFGPDAARAATSSRSLGPLDQAPVASDGAATVVFGIPAQLTLVAVDPDGDPLAFAVVTQPAHGALGPVVGNAVTYTPERNYLGADSFTFKA